MATKPAATKPAATKPAASPAWTGAPATMPADEPAESGGKSGGKPERGARANGWLLGLLLWAWIGLPFVKGGPTAVKNVWRAKFLNKAADGSELP